MFLSKSAKIEGTLEGNANVLGPSVIGENSLIGDGVIVGYPVQLKVLALGKQASFPAYDRVSEGSRIGSGCIIRSGTIIYEGSILGSKVETGHNVLIREKTTVGDGSRIGTNAVTDGNVWIGANCNIQTGVYLPPGTSLGSNIFMGPYVTVTNDRYPPSPKVSGVTISDGVAIGSRATLIAGVKIGKGAIVGAGAVVTKDIPDNIVVLGVPARRVMSREDYDQKQRSFLA
jgi:acetyltransferase-like isoleucine patch superfamily enzyme